MSFEKRFDQIIAHHKELGQKMAEADYGNAEKYVKMSKEYAELGPIAETIIAFRQARDECHASQEMLTQKDIDPDLKEMALEEIERLTACMEGLENNIRVLLLPKDEADEKNAILEIRAGTGGDEAALFARNLLRMYQRFGEVIGWKTEVMSLSETELGGIKEVILAVKGANVFARLKFESGVHRVQRVPSTETAGRIHTSAATVAVLPEAEEIDVKIEDKDLRIDVYRASGPGGQSVNTTDSAVRITHLPTGVVVQQQDEKSQHKNKAKALKILRSRVYEVQRRKTEDERAASRKGQVGSGDRSERIRTYNFPQSRVTDHRINLTLYKLDEILAGDALGEVIDALISDDQAAKLSELSA